MYQVYPNNMKLNMTFYAVFIATTDGKHVYSKVRVEDGKLGHLSNFTRKDFEDYYNNCHPHMEAPPLREKINIDQLLGLPTA
ncbi:hypothetical protein GCK32_010155 [Trichostrongylus colubriformis]|uniref:Uncharacterized protein n=1 Tax=Trichostrongylus colubriformis TaxID=6319 RepID=A0AAN8FIB7_TRICO